MKALLPFWGYIFFTAATTIFSQHSFAQASACPAVDAGADQTICSGNCVNLNAIVQGSVGTTAYTVAPIPYNPYSYTGSNSVLINIDDTWSAAIAMPFCFEFFGNTYNSIVIGSNAIITFDLSQAGGYCQWPIGAAIPSNTNPMNSIMGPWHDIDPSVGTPSSATDVNWQVYGSAPCREFVVSWNDVAMYDCNSLIATSQMVLHESTNIIDVYIQDKPICSTWNGGAAIEGIQDATGTNAYEVVGRNYPTQWSVTNDGQRFMPAGTPNYTVQWSDPNGVIATTNTVTVCPTVTTTYTATITNSSCSGPIVVSDVVTINVTNALTSSSSSTPASCTANTGTATATVSGGSGNYTYSWAPSGGNAATATGLASGTYTCTITDVNTGCIVTTTVTVGNSGGLLSTQTTNNILCNGGNNGSATVVATGGSGIYTYSWAPSGGNAATATGLSVGTYTCTITDSNGCTTTQLVTITEPSVITASASATQTSCTSNTGTATVVASGGTPGYTYSWAPSGGNAATAINLGASTYTCTITDANGCTQTATTTVTTVNGPSATLQSQVDVLCNGGNDGSATVNVTGGTPGYTYSWSPSGGTGATTSPGVTAGNYTCTITDAAGCTTTQSVSITQPAALSVAVVVAPIGCNTTTSATANPSGGTAPYTYSWSSGGTAQTENNLATGTYTVAIIDANGCMATQQFNVLAASPITVTSSFSNATCFNSNTGTATVSPTGGNPPYTYSWSPSGGTNATATGLGQGTYTCTITDANGCTTTQTVTITQPPAITATATHTNALCNGGSTGSATINASGGTGTLTYNWSPSGGTNATANNLPAGTYTCTITDANGCITTQTVTITQPTIVVASMTSDSICPGSSGSVFAVGSGGTGPYTYLWSNGATTASQSLTVTSNTSLTVTITDANGCTTNGVAGINLMAVPSASFNSNATNSAYQLTDGMGNLCFTNTSIGALTWVWDLNGSTSLQQSPCFAVTNADTGIFCASLVVVNGSGCMDTSEYCILIGESYYSIPNVFTPNGDGSNDGFVITNRGMKSLSCEIYNRWGELIYQWDGTNGYWDGKAKNGNEAVDGVYYYTAHLVDYSEKLIEESGFVQLISGK